MCGRYASSRRPEDLAGIFEIDKWDSASDLGADWNVAPTKEVYAVLDRPVKDAESREPVRQLRTLKWGLVPSWSKTPEGAARMINARAETVHEKPSYRRAFTGRRCILPADGYYEWVTAPVERELEVEGKKKRSRKQPYFVTPADGSVFAMAGLYEFWRDRTLPDEHPAAWWVTCSVITTEAETGPLGVTSADGPQSLSDIHPRMPLMLTPDRWDAWLDPSQQSVDELRSLLEPPPEGLMRAYPVSTAVSNVRNNSPELVTELEGPEVATLF
ncbi:putative SOS response-associated peptidase YedK [Streptomyces sp. YIM 130001]|uniref:SOS response-associated peptidase n=1 Tax=Streptomyces sp. YIM 130001 TaxID=2259644 RepID=UPI000E64CCDB|nr:SOS response-associated peptidase [Streptomyces sp. YIM 130001]RII16083.1 putative SOS response-associated peptidase YedK [Streptomyces sp. YIM 130001]